MRLLLARWRTRLSAASLPAECEVQGWLDLLRSQRPGLHRCLERDDLRLKQVDIPAEIGKLSTGRTNGVDIIYIELQGVQIKCHRANSLNRKDVALIKGGAEVEEAEFFLAVSAANVGRARGSAKSWLQNQPLQGCRWASFVQHIRVGEVINSSSGK